MRKFIFIIGLLTSFALPMRSESKNNFVPLKGLPFIYTSNSLDAELPDVSDSLFNAVAQGVNFDINSTLLRTSEPFVGIVRQQLVPLLRGKGLVLRRIIVRGAASPDGPYENNCRLGKGRTERLIELLQRELGECFDTLEVESNYICEDYGYLASLMKQAGDKDADRVKKVWEDNGGDERACKKALMSLDGGKAWNRWKTQYFPTLRQARVMLWFGMPVKETPKPEVKDTIPVAVPVTPIVVEPDTAVAVVEEPEKVKTPRLPLIAVRTNLLHDFFYMPNFGWAPGGNIQLEYFPLHGHLTYNIGFTFTNHQHWNNYKFFQIRDLQLELRRYFKEGLPYRGAYLAAYAHGFMYGVGFNKDKGWEGEGFGAGVSGGYTMKLIKSGHLRLEFMMSLGFLYTMYDPYIYGNPITGQYDGKYYYDYTGKVRDFKKRDHNRAWFGPTNLGVQLTYDLIYRKKGGRR